MSLETETLVESSKNFSIGKSKSPKKSSKEAKQKKKEDKKANSKSKKNAADDKKNEINKAAKKNFDNQIIDLAKDFKFKIDLTKEPQTIEETLNEIKSLLHNFLVGNVEESKKIFRLRSHVSFFYEVCISVLDFLDSLLKLDKEHLECALHSVTQANESANKHRKKMGIMGYLMRGDFSKHTDMEVYGEAAHSFTQVMNAFCVALLDQGIYGMVNAGIKAKTSYSSLKNCLYVLEDKKVWESEVSQKNFEANTRVFIGIYELIISFCPSKIARILDLIGFNSDRVNALENIRKSFDIKDTCVQELALIVLMIYHLFLNYFFGIGETDYKFIVEATKKWDNYLNHKEVFLLFGKGSRDLVLSKPQSAIALLEEAIKQKGHYRQIVYTSSWQLVWANCMLCNWSEAARYSELLKDNCKWSRALFHYLHAIFLQQMMDLEGKKELKKPIEDCLSLIPEIKRSLGGKLAFHERLVLTRSKKYVNNSEDMLLPAFELMYLWNVFNMMANNPELFNPMLELIETKLKSLDKKDEKKYLDSYCYLIFIKGVIYRHLNQKPAAIKYFEEIMKYDSKLSEKNLPPQACFEIGMINYETNNFKEAKKWFKKVKNLYSSYITQSLIEYRVQWVFDIIKSKKKNDNNLLVCEEDEE